MSLVHPQRKTLDNAHHNQAASLEHSKTTSEHIGHSKSAFEHNGSSDTTIQSTDHMVINPEAQPSPSIYREETKTAVVDTASVKSL